MGAVGIRRNENRAAVNNSSRIDDTPCCRPMICAKLLQAVRCLGATVCFHKVQVVRQHHVQARGGQELFRQAEIVQMRKQVVHIASPRGCTPKTLE